jgi:hypothetical protein
MQILAKNAQTETYIKQRFSDGSDRELVTVTRHIVKVAQDDKVYRLEFDHDPTDQEIMDAITTGEAAESKDPADQILLLNVKLREHSELIAILLQMQLEREGIL